MAARLTLLAGEIDGAWKILREVTANHGGLRVDEASVEMTLEHHQDTLHFGIKGGRFRGIERTLRHEQRGYLP